MADVMREIVEDVTWNELLPGDLIMGVEGHVFETLIVVAVVPGKSCTFFQTFSARAPELSEIERWRMGKLVKRDFGWQRVFRPSS